MAFTRIKRWVSNSSPVPGAQPVGGTIFYVDETSTGATYKFWDANGNELTTYSVS